jgi:glutathione peroxidase
MLASRSVPPSIWDISVTNITGETFTLSRYRDHVLLVVNVASRCGYTPQYAGLETLYRRHRDAGLVVLGFPCNQFGNQEPGSEAQIAEFCALSYDVTFPMFARVDVNGPSTHPLYRFLKSRRKGLLGTEGIKWNFTKFLVDRGGEVVDRFGSTDTPEAIEPAIVKLLAAPASASKV